MVHIVSYNIHFGKHIAKILAWLAREKRADIICFQEFPKHRLADCQKAFPKNTYGYRFAPSLQRRAAIYGELTVFRTDRMRLVSADSLPLRTTTLDRYSIGRASKRSCLVTKFQIQRKTLSIANIQLSCLASNALRYTQLTNIIHTLKQHTVPCLIIGDFNMSSLLGRKKLFRLMKKNSYKAVEKYMATHRLMMVKHQLDYIFARNCDVRHVGVERIRFSDHYPVTADVRLS
jgi:endonuclease/exonuclease/phosphatase family metal-dependent hydrolase